MSHRESHHRHPSRNLHPTALSERSGKKSIFLVDVPSLLFLEIFINFSRNTPSIYTVFDPGTGEISGIAGRLFTIDEEKLREEEKFDGYFAVITSEYKASPEEIIKVFKNVRKN